MTTMLSVQDAAELLGVSGNQIGRLIQAGELTAKRFGPLWAVDPMSVQRRAALRPTRGRPLSPRKAWALLDETTADRHAAVEDVMFLAVATRRRSERRLLRALPVALDDILNDRRVVVSGAAAAQRLGAAVDSLPPHDLYTLRSGWHDLVTSHRLREPENEAEANLRVRVVDDDVWPFAQGDHVASPLIAAVDLVDSLDHRSAAEVISLIGQP